MKVSKIINKEIVQLREQNAGMLETIMRVRDWIEPQTHNCNHHGNIACEHDAAMAMLRRVNRALKHIINA